MRAGDIVPAGWEAKAANHYRLTVKAGVQRSEEKREEQ